eukprot:COSAG06_NODE_17746_length_923_cov_1.378641_1_plen_98_part_10
MVCTITDVYARSFSTFSSRLFTAIDRSKQTTTQLTDNYGSANEQEDCADDAHKPEGKKNQVNVLIPFLMNLLKPETRHGGVSRGNTVAKVADSTRKSV